MPANGIAGNWREGLSIAEFARRAGVSAGSLNTAIAHRRLERLPDGSIDPKYLKDNSWRSKKQAKSLQNSELYDAEISLEDREKKVRGRPPKNPGSLVEEINAMANDEMMEPEEIAAAQAKKLLGFLNHNQAILFKETYLALSRKLEFDKEVRSVAPMAEMARENARQLAAYRSIADNIAPTVAPLLVGMKNPNEIQAIIQKEIDESLKAFIEV